MTNVTDPSWLPTLDELPISHRVEVAEASSDFLSLPARPGVAVFEGDDARPLLIATTADLRELARRRLGQPFGGDTPGNPGPRADHRAITRRILAIEVGSALEADIVYLAQARRRMPETHRLVSERWRAWFVHVDPDAVFPLWSKSCLTGGVAPRSASRRAGPEAESGRGLLLGPLADKDAAGRFIELMIDAFDLCRDESLLVQAPRARACAYKEMGRCASPCDGSEPMPSYRLRTRRAIETVTRGLAEMRSRFAADMQAAAAATDFELATELKQQFDRLERLAAPAFAHVTEVRAWRAVILLPTPRPGRARLLVLCGGRLGMLEDMEITAGTEILEPLAAQALEAAGRGPAFSPGPAPLDTLAAVTRWLYTASKRRRGVHILIRTGMDAAALAHELSVAAKGLRKVTEAAVPDQTIEA
jgi:DNA polymerase-3 subunit epsilon